MALSSDRVLATGTSMHDSPMQASDMACNCQGHCDILMLCCAVVSGCHWLSGLLRRLHQASSRDAVRPHSCSLIAESSSAYCHANLPQISGMTSPSAALQCREGVQSISSFQHYFHSHTQSKCHEMPSLSFMIPSCDLLLCCGLCWTCALCQEVQFLHAGKDVASTTPVYCRLKQGLLHKNATAGNRCR